MPRIALLPSRRPGVTAVNSQALLFDLDPDRHRVQAHVFARQAGKEQLAAVLALEERTKNVRNLESALIIYAGLLVASKHTKPLNGNHFSPQISTEILSDGSVRVNRKIKLLSQLRQIFAF